MKLSILLILVPSTLAFLQSIFFPPQRKSLLFSLVWSWQTAWFICQFWRELRLDFSCCHFMTDAVSTCTVLISLPYIFASEDCGIVTSLGALRKCRWKVTWDCTDPLATFNCRFQNATTWSDDLGYQKAGLWNLVFAEFSFHRGKNPTKRKNKHPQNKTRHTNLLTNNHF